jgi:Ca2+-binding RTX toxin-like protein
LIFGGRDADVLDGGEDRDILESGWGHEIRWDRGPYLILEEWASSSDYETAQMNIRADPVLLQADVSVFDREPAHDELTGGLGRDWFFAQFTDSIMDRGLGGIETLDLL